MKTNIGHLEAAAGVAGLIKTALALHHGELPASLHFTEPNPEIDFEASRLRVLTELEPWPNGQNRLAMINSFGFGGANANFVLREAPNGAVAPAPEPTTDAQLLTVSARSPEALEASAREWLTFLAREKDSVPEICAAAAHRRAHHAHRLAVVARTKEELVDGIDAFIADERPANVASGRRPGSGPPKLVFLFSGMGPQWWGMARGLLKHDPVFREAVERCDAALQGLVDWSLVEELKRDEQSTRVHESELAQMMNFAVQVGLAEVWRGWGVVPDAVVGHSAGETAAAWYSGALYARGRRAPDPSPQPPSGAGNRQGRDARGRDHARAGRVAGLGRRVARGHQRANLRHALRRRRDAGEASSATSSSGRCSRGCSRSRCRTTAARWTRSAASCSSRWRPSSHERRRSRSCRP